MALALTGLGATPALAQWGEELSEQVREELGCKVAFLSQVVERTVEGRRTITARVHCEDKRAFDAYRADDFEPFEIRACEQPDAEVC